MAPRRQASRRSTRLLGVENGPGDGLVAPADAPESRITKPRTSSKPKKPARLDCSTCGRSLVRSSFPKAATHNCKHDVNTCKACLKTWIATQLDNTTYDKLSCPECPELMNNADVQSGATKGVYGRFVELERRGIADNTPGWRWCLAPDCKAGQVHQPSVEIIQKSKPGNKKSKKAQKSAVDDICECNECGAKACVPCDRPFHEGETCKQYQKRTQQFEKDEKATLETIEQECKQCPTCKKNIQRNGGCDQIRCTQCSSAFCWLCLLSYDKIDKDGHARGCIYAIAGRIDPHAPNAPQVGVQANNAGGGGGGLPGFFMAMFRR